MRITTNKIEFKLDVLPSSKHLLRKDFLIFDIETTGFSREYDFIYMIGCIYKKDHCYEYLNLFAENFSEENEIILAFFTILKDFDCLIHFNGNRFDIPFLLTRAEKHTISNQLSPMESIDIYDLLRPYRKYLPFPNLKLDTIQNQLGYIRKDTYTGGDLIQVYQNYAKEPYKPYYDLLLLHNKEDVEGMIYLLPFIDILNLLDYLILKEDFKFLTTNSNTRTLEIIYSLPHSINMDFELSYQNCVFKMFSASNKMSLTLPIYQDKKKLFFDNYKDYMYLPEKDEVVHKSIAAFMPTDKKIKAKKSNCYITHIGSFIPVFSSKNIERLFKDDFKDKNCYTILDESLDSHFFNHQLIGFLEVCKQS